jgi:hypothetical protein
VFFLGETPMKCPVGQLLTRPIVNEIDEVGLEIKVCRRLHEHQAMSQRLASSKGPRETAH